MKKLKKFVLDYWYILLPGGIAIIIIFLKPKSANQLLLKYTGMNTDSILHPNGGTRAQRNNNPGNMRDAISWQGKTGVDDKGFNIYDTLQNGIRAGLINLINQKKIHGLDTINKIMYKYAPPSDDNATDTYINILVTYLNDHGQTITKYDTLSTPEQFALLFCGIAKVESGTDWLNHGMVYDEAVNIY